MIDNITAHWVANNTAYEVVYCEEPTSAPAVTYYRQPHDLEMINFNLGDAGRKFMGPGYRAGKVRQNAVDSGKTIPEVYRAQPGQVTPLNSAWVDFVCALNYEFSREIALDIFDPHWAWNNRRETPGFNEPLICGGALLRGSVDSGYLWIDGLLTSEPVPDPVIILNKPGAWYYGTEVNPKGVVTWITRAAKDGTRKPVRIPILSRLPLYVPLTWLERMPAGFDPATYDARKFS